MQRPRFRINPYPLPLAFSTVMHLLNRSLSFSGFADFGEVLSEVISSNSELETIILQIKICNIYSLYSDILRNLEIYFTLSFPVQNGIKLHPILKQQAKISYFVGLNLLHNVSLPSFMLSLSKKKKTNSQVNFWLLAAQTKTAKIYISFWTTVAYIALRLLRIEYPTV